MQAMPCGHCNNPRCRLCLLYRSRADYRALWAAPDGVTPAPPPDKPRVSIAELAEKRRRCQQAKAAGRPCTEFAPAPAPPTETTP